MLENVRNLTAHDKGRTFKTILKHLEALGYNVHHKVLNALDFGVPQKRERIIIVGFLENVDFDFPESLPKSQHKYLGDILEKFIDESSRYYINEDIKQSRFARMKTHIEEPYITHENVAGSVTPHHFSCALRAGASANYLLINNVRQPTERELLRLQGLSEDYKIVVSYTAIRKQTGNSVCVPMVEAVAKNMITTLKRCEGEKNESRAS